MSTASARDLALDIAARLTLGPVSVKRFFGGAALVMDGVQFGFAMKGSLYLRVDDASRAGLEAMGASPFSYDGGSRTVTVASYYETPDLILEDDAVLRHWIGRAHLAALAARNHSGATKRRRKKSTP